MVDSLQTQARLIEELRATNAAQAETILELRAGNERLRETIAVHTETIEMLKAEIRQLKRLPGKPDIKPGAGDGDGKGSGGKGLEGGRRSSGASKKRRGPKQGRKDAKRVVVCVEDAPEGSVHKDYQDYHAQLLELEVHNVVFQRERVVTPDGRIIVAELPDGVIGGFNLELHRFVLMLYHQGQSTIPRITALLDAIGLDISERQVRRLLTGNREPFVGEAAEILKAGLEGAAWISVDDTGARHQGRNGYCISIGNDCFGWFGTTGSKSRLSFLDTMCGALDEYVLNDEAFRHMESHSMPRRALDALRGHAGSRFDGPDLWMAFLDGLGIDAPRARLLATEGARLGCLFAHGLLREDSAILSDDAGQFDLGLHQFLCWIHAERLYRTLPVWSDASRAAVDQVRGGIWRTYRLLGAYCRQPSPRRRAVVKRSFARTFRTGTGYRLLDEQIGRTLANRDKLLAVLDRPDVPAHTNGTENDLRVCVVRRKVSGGTRSDQGRACRDAFLTHMKTCARHGISFWNYLGDRLGIPGAESVPWLPDLARQRPTAGPVLAPQAI